MSKRFVAIWFRHLTTDWMIRRQSALKDVPFVMAAPDRGRMVVKAVNTIAESNGVHKGMVIADCRAILPTLQVFDYKEGLADKLLAGLGEWCICFTPIVAVDPPDGLILDASGCPHLWGGEKKYLHNISSKLKAFGYDVRLAIADTIGTAWANARYGRLTAIIETGKQWEALLPLPSAALRIDPVITERLEKLGLYQIKNFITMPRTALRRRFGQSLLNRLDQALGQQIEVLQPVKPIELYQERLPSLEPIRTATGIEIALQQLLETLCKRLEKESKGLRTCVLKCFRIDGNLQQINIGTSRASRNATHLFRLFELKIATIEPDLGIEVFLLEATIVEELTAAQEKLWLTSGNNEMLVAELVDRLTGKFGNRTIHRYLPAEHHWPERSIKEAASLQELPAMQWREEIPRPIHLLQMPEPIEVMVPIPDYPPMHFRYRNELHTVKKADGPERIEQEWWLQQGLYRDYYSVEDEKGGRYWLFRLGHYDNAEPKWYMHGFFA